MGIFYPLSFALVAPPDNKFIWVFGGISEKTKR